MPKVTAHAAGETLLAAASVAANVATGGVIADIDEGMKLYQLLEPPLQHAIAALIHKLHGKHQAAAPAPATAAQPKPASEPSAAPAAKPDLSSTSLDPENPYVPTT